MTFRPRVVFELAKLNFREFLRTPEAVFWTYGFPILMAVVLGLAFQSGELPKARVVVPDGVHADAVATALQRSDRVLVTRLPEQDALRALHRGKFDLMVGGSAAEPVFAIDPTRPEADTARMVVDDALQTAAGRRDAVTPRIDPVTAPGSRYIDFLIPGLIGLNLLGAGMFGVGFNLVNMRERHLLRRLIVAPMGRFEFLAAFLGSRLLLVVPESLIVAAFGVLAFGVPFEGSLFLLLFAVLLGGIAFSGLGLLIAARPRTTEGVGGMMNLIMIPMWLLGGAFFSNERFPDWIQPVVQALPLTQMNEALRAILLTGDGIGAVALPLAYLAAFGVASMWLAVRIFRWT